MSISSPSIAMHNLSFKWPDGTRVFENLSESLHKSTYGLVGDNGSGKTTLFNLIAARLRPTSGSVFVNGKLALMRQVTAYAEDTSVADRIGVTSTMALMQKAEQGLATIEELAEIDWQLESKVEALFERVGLGGLSLSDKASELSGGQQTRLAFAGIQYLQPDVILLDEPTNNLDQSGRVFVADFLRNFPGLSVTVSHDRKLLNSFDTTLELSASDLKVYGGNWEFYKSQKSGEISRVEHVLRSAKKTLLESERHAQKVKERKDRKDAAGRRKNKSGANAKILMNAQAERAENSSGLTRSDTAKRQSAISKQIEYAASKIERLTPLKIDLPTSGLPSSREILRLSDVSIGHDNGPVLARGISFSMVGPERVFVAGENGTGKSTLVKTIASQIPLRSGEMKVTQRLRYLDQSVECLARDMTLVDNFLRLNPSQNTNDAQSALARFKFRNDAAHKRVSILSGGETLRAGLACILCGDYPPELLILDEPTNHLDIGSIETVEAALRCFDGGLIIVSHDMSFVKSLDCSRRLDIGGSVSELKMLR